MFEKNFIHRKSLCVNIKYFKMSVSQLCYLQSLDTNKRIDLPHMEVVILGRNELTDIKDLSVSKRQVICYSDLTSKKLKLKPVGLAISGCNGLALHKDLIYTIGHKDIIEVKIGSHKFEVIFNQDSNKEVNEPVAKKPKTDFSVFKIQEAKTNNTEQTTWEEIDNKELLVYTTKNCQGKSKIAGFDIDGTIIKTKSGAKFPKNADDWTWNYDDIKDHLAKLHNNNFKLVFFTNQSGVGKDPSRIKEFKRKIDNIISKLNLPIQVFVSLGKKMHRKPKPGMWDLLVNHKNDSIDVKISESFFVGDAAGREKNWAPKRNKDHSAADRLFAINIGLKFYTPEEFFLKQRPAPYKMPEFDPRIDTSRLNYPDLLYDKLNVVLMVGGPGSGKSSFVKNQLIPEGYVHLSRDKLGSWQKCVSAMENALGQKKNVVIDNTNVDKETRQRFIQAAKKCNADIRCFIMETSLAQMRHNNKFREMTDKSHAVVSDIIIFSYRKNYQEPELSEGYAQILKIPFICRFSDKAQEKLYRTFLLE